MNVIARLEYELAYYDSAVHRFNHYTMRTLPHERWRCSWSQFNIQMVQEIFWSVCKNLDDQARSGKHKTVNSEAVLQTIDANPARSNWRVSGELGLSQSNAVHHLYDLDKSIQNGWIVPDVTKILQNFWLMLKNVLWKIYKWSIFKAVNNMNNVSCCISALFSVLLLHCWRMISTKFTMLTLPKSFFKKTQIFRWEHPELNWILLVEITTLMGGNPIPNM